MTVRDIGSFADPSRITRIRAWHAGCWSAGMLQPLPLAASDDRLCVLRFASSFLWADLELDLAEHAFFLDLATELGVPEGSLPELLDDLLSSPPEPEDVDPTRVSPALAATVRNVALRAIASDGRVLPREMELFELLDELLPQVPS